MSWDSYIDNLIAQSKDGGGQTHVDKACIIGLDGGARWTSDDHASALKVANLAGCCECIVCYLLSLGTVNLLVLEKPRFILTGVRVGKFGPCCTEAILCVGHLWFGGRILTRYRCKLLATGVKWLATPVAVGSCIPSIPVQLRVVFDRGPVCVVG